eukprot:451362_1
MSQSRRNSRRKSNTDKTPQLRKRTSSKFHHSFIRAKLKLTNTKQSLEPTEITEAKLRLKSTKNITTSLEPIVNNLYWAQHEHSRLMSELSNTLTNITINNNNDKFGIFLKNMGRVQQNLEEIDEMYLINMKDQFLDPLKEFNATQIKKCQQTKLKLKTIKGQFDLKKKSETKLLKTQSEKRISLDKVHSVQTATSKKLNELLSVRDEFVSCVNTMEKNKLHLLSSFAEYMDSFMAYSKMHSTNIELQTKSMNVMPPKIAANKSQLDSDTEECFMNDFNEQQKTLNDWGKSSVVVKEGIFKKRGAVNKSFKKRWFKLFTNKKLTYFDINDYGNGPNGMLKGHANLTNIVQINTKKNSLIEIQTKTRKWIFSYDNIEDRDEWYNIFQQTCVQNVTRTMKQTANDFGDMFIDGNGNNNNNNLDTFDEDENKNSNSKINLDFNSLNTESIIKYPYKLDVFQKQSICAIENNDNVLVSAHTSAGKTTVAEYAIAKALSLNQRVIYTSPIKALSNQKYRQLQERFIDVGLMTGDTSLNRDASCIVMTTEILRNMLYRGAEIIREITWIIFDEIHYMRDPNRGVVWEETLILLPSQSRFVFLSATIPNNVEFAKWISKINGHPCHVIYTEMRP